MISSNIHKSIVSQSKTSWVDVVLLIECLVILFIILLGGAFHNIYYQYITDSVFQLVISILLIANSALICFRTRSIKIKLIDIIFVILFVYITIHTYYFSNLLFNSYHNVAAFLALYWLFRSIEWKSEYINLSFIAILCYGIVEVAIGLYQLVAFVSSDYSKINITGTFNNPAPFSCFLCVCISLTQFQGLNWNIAGKSMKIFVSYLLPLIFVVFILLSGSRTGILSVTLLAILFGWRSNKFRKAFITRNFSLKILVLGILMSGFMFFLYYAKQDSSSGRLLIWKVTSQLYLKNPLTGVGIENFQSQYANQQAIYFSANGKLSHDAFLADAIKSPYNEFLHILISIGPIALAILLYVFYIAFLSCYFNTSVNRADNFIIILQSIGMIFLIFSMFSFPFQNLALCFLFIVFIAMSNKYKEVVFNVRYPNILFCLSLFYLLLIFNSYSVLGALNKWVTINRDFSTPMGKLNSYNKIETQLRTNGHFLYNYGVELYRKGEYKRSKDMLFQSASRISNSKTFVIIGDCYQKLKKYKEAERMYMFAIDMYPNRLIPRYQLFSMYQELQDTTKSRKIALEIIETPVKINSEITLRIKDEATRFIKQSLQY